MTVDTRISLELFDMQSARMKSGDGKPVPGTGKKRRGGLHGTGSRTDKK